MLPEASGDETETEALIGDNRHQSYSRISEQEEERINQSKKLPQYIATISATGGALAAGTIFGWSSPTEILIVDRANDTNFIGEYGFHVTVEEWSWVGSLVTLGAAIMCLLIGSISKRFGRKLTMLLLIIPFSVGWILVIWPTSVIMLYIGRFILGIAGGSFFVVAPMYIGETAEKDIRGKLGSFFQLMVTIGILIVYLLGNFLNVFTLSLICGIVPLVFGGIFLFMPETPQYFITKGRTDDAINSIKWLKGSNYDYTVEINQLQNQHEQNMVNKITLIDAFKRPASKKAMIISLGLMIFLQFSAINAVVFYTGFIFTNANADIDPEFSTVIVGVMQVLATFIASMIIDHLGRRILLLFSISIMAFCKILLGLYFYLYARDESNVQNITWLPLFSLCLYIVAFSLGFGPIPWVMIGELFAPEVKDYAASISGSTSWILAFVVTKTFSNIRESIGLGESFWLFSAFSICGVIFVFFIVPETKGKSLDDIQRMLANSNRTQSETIVNE